MLDSVFILVFIFMIVLLILFSTGKSSILNQLENLKAENKRIIDLLKKLNDKLGVEPVPPIPPVPNKAPIPEVAPAPLIYDLIEETEIPEVAEASTDEKWMKMASVPEVITYRQEKPQEKTPKKDLEKFFGINLLSKIGIATLVLGIAYFVKYAIDQNWINEIGRVAIGIFAGGTLVGVAHKLRTNYRTFSSILVGGGISVLYITIVLAFWEYKLFAQPVAFALLVFITAVSVFLSIAYDKKELAIFSLLGGFASPLMVSSGAGNYIVLFTYLLILNAGMLTLAYKKGWKVVSCIAYGLTLLFYWIWLLCEFDDQYAGAVVFALLFFLQFYLLAMIDYFKQKERKITIFQAVIITGNNLSLFAASLYIIQDLDINLKGIVTITMALLNAIPLWFVIKDKAVNKQMLYMLIATVLTFVSLAAPVQLNGGAITMFWAVETVVLRLLYRQSSIKLFKFGYFILQVFVIFSLLMDWSTNYGAHLSGILITNTFVTGLVVLATMWVNSRFIRKYKLDIILNDNQNIMYNILNVAMVVLLYFVLFLELRYQLQNYDASSVLITIITGLYSCLFLAVYTFVIPKKKNWIQIFSYLLILFTAWYVFYYLFTVVALVRIETLSGWSSMIIHYFTIPAVIVIFRYLLVNCLHIGWSRNGIYWFVTIASTIIVSIEADNTLLLCFSNHIPESELLSYSHTIVYPILWGIGAFILMILGMKRRNRSLRIISLSLFALIIAKLYLYDIWQMSQAGRIIAFISLGLLFLLVSFLYQKLKVLLQKDEK